ncbi:MAG: hypothetical protein WA765_08645 [Candidatus Acidiferrum sp.]
MTTKQLTESLAQASRIVVLVLLVGVIVCPAHTQRADPEFELGGQRLHERLKLFRARFPGAVCGSPLDGDHINRHTLDDPDNSGWLTCCIDKPKEVSAFSKFKVLAIDNNCPVLVAFYQERLHDIRFYVDASSVETVLPDFVKRYGPVQRDLFILTKTVPVRFASWEPYGSTLELSEQLLSCMDVKIDPPVNKGTSEGKVVLLDMFAL